MAQLSNFQKIKYLIRLFRLPNLIIMAATMVLIRYAIIQPIFLQYGIDFEFSSVLFTLLVMAVVLIAAAGYLINDYFDVKIDLVNKPDEVVLDKYIRKKTAFRIYAYLNIVALALGFYVSAGVGVLGMFFIFPVTMGILWFYSTTYKQQLLIGNILVSLLIGILPLLVALFEMPPIHQKYHDYPEAYRILLNVVFSWCGFFALFAFTINLIREFIKDAEDYEGDHLHGRNTLPIALGINTTKIVINVLILIVISVLLVAFVLFLSKTNLGRFDWVTFLYFIFLLILPLFVIAGLVLVANEKKRYALASAMVKLVMIAGVLYAIVVRFKLT